MSIRRRLTYVNARSDDNISGVSIFVPIKVSVMTMKKVSREFVCHFKQNFLLRVVFSLRFHVESNLNAM